MAAVAKGRSELVVDMIPLRILVIVAFLPMLATAEIRLQSDGWWKVSTDKTTCNLKFYLRDHPHDVPDHGANFLINLLNVSEPPRIGGQILDESLVPVLRDSLVIEAWPSLADTAIASMSFQIGKESIRPIHEEKRAGSMRQLFVFSSTETALFIDAMLSDHTVTVRWRHDDGHADERTITVTGFEARREYFEICKSRIAE